tara:strand:+ start:86 stop:187 length:102 start_codon:yes stop_codon:yes gene_type:complete
MTLKTIDTIALVLFTAALLFAAYNATAYGFQKI